MRRRLASDPGKSPRSSNGAFNPAIHPGDEFAFDSPRERSQIGSRRATLKGREELSLSIRFRISRGGVHERRSAWGEVEEGQETVSRRKSAALLSTAFHEAGHAVACWRHGLKVHSATIIPAHDLSGAVQHANPLRGIRLDINNSARGRQRAESTIIICLAGPAAQRRHSPRSWRSHHGAADHALAVDLALTMNGSAEATNAYLRWLEIATRDEIAILWPKVEKLAHALFERFILTAAEIEAELAVIRPRGHIRILDEEP
jgi:hypothetical protein